MIELLDEHPEGVDVGLVEAAQRMSLFECPDERVWIIKTRPNAFSRLPEQHAGLGIRPRVHLGEDASSFIQLAVTAISQRDIPLVQGVVLSFALVFTLLNLAVDVLNGALDPRIREAGNA